MDLVSTILWITGFLGLIALLSMCFHLQNIIKHRDRELAQSEVQAERWRYDLRWEKMLRESADEDLVKAKAETEAYRTALIEAETRQGEAFELNLTLAKARMDADNARIAIRNEADEQIRDLRGTIDQLSMTTQLTGEPIVLSEGAIAAGQMMDRAFSTSLKSPLKTLVEVNSADEALAPFDSNLPHSSLMSNLSNDTQKLNDSLEKADAFVKSAATTIDELTDAVRFGKGE